MRRLMVSLPPLNLGLGPLTDSKEGHFYRKGSAESRNVVSPGSMLRRGPDAPLCPMSRIHTQAIVELLRTRDPDSPRLAGPAHVMPHVFLGDMDAAMNTELLASLGIDAIVNCAATSVLTSKEFYLDDFAYVGFDAEDLPGYDLLGRHFEEMAGFLDTVAVQERRALVHCAAGINRSAALVVAYYMVRANLRLPEAVKHCFQLRPVILCNEGFIEQLVAFAYARNLL